MATIGSIEGMNYTALGAVVNLAARLEGTNKEYGAEKLITEAVYERFKHRFWRKADIKRFPVTSSCRS